MVIELKVIGTLDDKKINILEFDFSVAGKNFKKVMDSMGDQLKNAYPGYKCLILDSRMLDSVSVLDKQKTIKKLQRYLKCVESWD